MFVPELIAQIPLEQLTEIEDLIESGAPVVVVTFDDTRPALLEKVARWTERENVTQIEASREDIARDPLAWLDSLQLENGPWVLFIR